MRLFSIFSLIIFTLCILLINGKSYQPKRQGSSSYDPNVDSTTLHCQQACNRACEENCGSILCESDAGYSHNKHKCIGCFCPESISEE